MIERFSVFISEPNSRYNGWRWKIMGDKTSAIYSSGMENTIGEAEAKAKKSIERMPDRFNPTIFWLGEEYAREAFKKW
jgi:hypothetical protein